MTAAELRALCVARIEASKLVGHGMERAAGDALSRALDIHMHVCMPERSARAILAALDDAERVATERAQRGMTSALYYRAGQAAIEAATLRQKGQDDLAASMGTVSCDLWDAALDAEDALWDAAFDAEDALRESAKGKA